MNEGYYRGLVFLDSTRLRSGEFPFTKSPNADLVAGTYLKTVFGTAVIAYSLSLHGRGESVSRILEDARRFLKAEREASGYWRFFGKGSAIAQDLDTTSYALSALNEFPLDDRTRQLFLKYRRADGLFPTWVTEEGTNADENNPIDWVVNANVLQMMTRGGVTLDDTVASLFEVLRRRQFEAGTKYYPSPLIFLHAVSRLIPCFGENRAAVEQWIIEYAGSSAVPCDPLSHASALSALLNCSYRGEETDVLKESILSTQQADGGWPACSYFIEPVGLRLQCDGSTVPIQIYHYGSRALTTAFCLEAMALSAC